MAMIHSIKLGQWKAEWSHVYYWLQEEIGSDNWDWDWNHKAIIFTNEEDKVKFILRWT